jgi:asparagine synthase (glutamine-hydrolysing)
MPGIAGIIGAGGNAERYITEVTDMVEAMRHDRSYSTGTYANAAIGIYVGWAAHPGSFADCMPLWNKTRDICLIFTGEDFPDSDTLDALRARGHEFNAGTASYLVSLYEEAGDSFLERLNGGFSGLLIDLRSPRIVLFNDRFGLRRIHYHEHPGAFYFGSEAKSLLSVLPQLREVDPTALGELFSVGCVMQDRTLFPGIQLLPAATKWTFRGNAEVIKERYFDPGTWERLPILAAVDFCAQLKATYRRILPRYLSDMDQLAMSLTGGLDGRMIMACANLKRDALPCYTFVGEYRECADARIARHVARLCGQQHRTLMIGEDFRSGFRALAEKAIYISDGTMDVSGSVEIYANKLARTIAPIRLTGNYGSEIVRGNVAFRPSGVNHELLSGEFVPFVRAAHAAYDAARQGREISFIAFKQVPWHHYGRMTLESSQLTPRSPFLDNELVALMYQAPPECIRSRIPSLELIADGNARLASLPTDRGSVLERSPIIGFGRRAYQEITMKAEYAYDYGMPQWLAAVDHALAPLRLERLFLGRHKFYHFRVWYRDDLASYLKDMLLDPRSLSRPYVNARQLEKIVNEHVRGIRNHTSEIHQILTAELVYRLLIEQP